MAEAPDKTGTEETSPAAPTFDPAAIEKMVQGAVRTSIEALVKEAQAATPEQSQTLAPKPAADPMNDLFRPALEPAMNAAKAAEIRAALAADAVDFYTTHAANPTVLKHKDKIETTIAAQLKRGNLISRKDAWNWLRGGELYGELEKETLTAHEKKLQEAREAAAVGPSVTVPKFSKPIEDLKTEELGEALKGVTF